jgi:hypothetical protein
MLETKGYELNIQTLNLRLWFGDWEGILRESGYGTFKHEKKMHYEL